MKKIAFYLCTLLCLAGIGAAQIPSILPSSPIYETLVLLKGGRIKAGQYLNFGPVYGTSGYGIKDNSGTLQYKNSGGAWANLGGGGGGTFIGLTDVPVAFTGAGGQLVRVNAGETALEFVGLSPTINATGFSLAGGTSSKTLTVEDTSLINQDLTTDASPTLAGLTLGSVSANGVLNLYGLHANGYYSTIKGSNAEGLVGSDLRIGLDESNRTLVICDKGDINTDFGLAAQTYPSIIVYDSTPTYKTVITGQRITAYNIYSDGALGLFGSGGSVGLLGLSSNNIGVAGDTVAGNVNTIGNYNWNGAAQRSLTDTDGRQAVVYVPCGINQSGTAAFDGLYLNATLTSVGSGATGDGNNLLNLSVSAVPKFLVNVDGSVTAGQTSVSLADNAVHDTGITAFYGQLTVKDTTTGVTGIFRLDGGATPVIISAHTNFSTTQGTDVKINVYFSTTYKIENCNTAASVVKCAFVGTI